MIIFNNTDHPISVKIGDRELEIEPCRYVEETIPEGEYPILIHKQKKNGKPMKLRGKSDEEWGMMGYRWCLSSAVSGAVITKRDTKLHIDQKYRRYCGYGRNKSELELLECTIENGELQNLQSFFPKSYHHHRIMRDLYLTIGILFFIHPGLFLCLLENPSQWLIVLVFQVLFLFSEWEIIRAIRILRNYSVKEIK